MRDVDHSKVLHPGKDVAVANSSDAFHAEIRITRPFTSIYGDSPAGVQLLALIVDGVATAPIDGKNDLIFEGADYEIVSPIVDIEIDPFPAAAHLASEAPSAPKGAGPGEKDDSGPGGMKSRHDLIPTALEDGVARVLTYGAFQRPRADGRKGYGKNNWQGVDDAQGRYFAALRRHLAAWRRGEKVDHESGLSHLAHAATNLAFLMSFESGHDPVM